MATKTGIQTERQEEEKETVVGDRDEICWKLDFRYSSSAELAAPISWLLRFRISDFGRLISVAALIRSGGSVKDCQYISKPNNHK